MIEQIIVLLQKGMEEKVTFAKESIEGTLEQLNALQGIFISDSRFMSQFWQRKKYKSEALKIVRTRVLPAFNHLENFMKNEYMQHLRKGPGLMSLGNLKGGTCSMSSPRL